MYTTTNKEYHQIPQGFVIKTCGCGACLKPTVIVQVPTSFLGKGSPFLSVFGFLLSPSSPLFRLVLQEERSDSDIFHVSSFITLVRRFLSHCGWRFLCQCYLNRSSLICLIDEMCFPVQGCKWNKGKSSWFGMSDSNGSFGVALIPWLAQQDSSGSGLKHCTIRTIV